MTRPLRLEFSGALYHLTARGNARGNIFRGDEDRYLFLELLGKEISQQGWRCYAYCLMGNHYHLLIETPSPNLVAGMRRLNGVYTQAFNRRHRHVGHVLQGRYKSILVDKDSYGLELCRYIVLNPVRARRVKGPEHWAWSSYRATVGQVVAPTWLDVDWVLGQFGGRGAAMAYQGFVLDGIERGSPWGNLRGQIWLGDEAFLKRMQRLAQGKPNANVPRAQRCPAHPTAGELTQAVLSAYQIKDEKTLCLRGHQEAFQAWIYLLRRAANLTLWDAARRGKVSLSRVSKIQRGLESGPFPDTLRQLLGKCKIEN